MSNVIFSAYFTSVYDKNREIYIPKDSYQYMSPIYNSVIKLKLNLIIFYDDLSSEFVNEHTTQKIKFVKIDMKKFNNFEPHDIRFIVLNKFLKKHNYENMFLTDLCDVFINKNPFNIFKNNSILCIQQDVDQTIKDNIWSRINFCRICKVNKIEDTILGPYVNNRLMNCGIIGGSKHVFIEFIRLMANKIIDLTNGGYQGIKDMIVVNYVFYKYYNNKITVFTGDMLHSPFHKYIVSDKYYFSHK